MNLLTLSLMGALSLPRASVASEAPVSITATIVSCSADEKVVPTLSMTPFGTPANQYPTPILGKVVATSALGVYRGTVTVAPQNYTVAAKSPNCSTPGLMALAVYPNLDRNAFLVTVANPTRVVSLLNNSIAVLAPAGVAVDLVPYGRPLVGQRQRFPVRDGDAYYFESLDAGRYLLEMSASGIVACRLVTVPDGLSGFQKLVGFGGVELPEMMRSASARRNDHICATTP